MSKEEERNRRARLPLLVAGLVVGLIVAAVLLGVVGPPNAGLHDRGDWKSVSDERITIETTYWIANPNPIGFSNAENSILYALALNDITLATGNKSDFTVPQGNTTDSVTSTLYQQRIPGWWVSHLGNNETSQLRIKTTVTVPVGPFDPSVGPPPISQSVSTDILGTIERSLARSEGSYPQSGATVAIVEDTSARWGRVTEDETPLLVTFTVRNPNRSPLPVPAFAGNVTFNRIEMARWRANEIRVRKAPEDGTIPPQSTEQITFVTTIDNDRIDSWLTSHIRRGERTDLAFTGSLAFTYDGETYTVPHPYGFRCTAEMQTAILVDNQSAAAGFTGCDVGSERIASRLRDTTQQLLSDNRTSIPQPGTTVPADRPTVPEPTRTLSPDAPTVPSGQTVVGSPPTARISATPRTGEAPLTVTLDASGSTDPDDDIERYRWLVDGETFSKRGRQVEVRFETPRTYRVKLIVVDRRGNSDTATITVEITRPAP